MAFSGHVFPFLLVHRSAGFLVWFNFDVDLFIDKLATARHKISYYRMNAYILII